MGAHRLLAIASAQLFVLAAGLLHAQSPAPPRPPVPVLNVPDIEDLTPEQIRARLGVGKPCPAGLVPYSANDFAMLRMTPDDFWMQQLTEMLMMPPEMQRMRQELYMNAAKLATPPELEATYRCRPPDSVMNPGAGMATAGALPGVGGGLPGAVAGIAGGKGGAVGAAAPMAAPLAKGLAGMFGKKPETPDGMAKDLGKGRLELREVAFLAGSTQLSEGAEKSVGVLAEALASVVGRFYLLIQSEADSDMEPDPELLKARRERLEAMLRAAGVAEDRVVLGDPPAGLLSAKDLKPVKLGEARAIVLRIPQ